MSLVILPYSIVGAVVWMGMTVPMTCWTAASSSAGESPAFGADELRGNTTRLALYAFSLLTLACRLSKQRLRRRWSTAMPMVGATLEGMPASWTRRKQE